MIRFYNLNFHVGSSFSASKVAWNACGRREKLPRDPHNCKMKDFDAKGEV